MTGDSLQARNGLLYVVNRWPMSDEPEVITSWYPTGIPARDYPDYLGQRLECLGSGQYRPEGPRVNGFRPQFVFALLKGGDTLPEFTEREPLPCPKVRKGTETRYCQGRWEKLLRKGWVPA
jgi:hypothetical protein